MAFVVPFRGYRYAPDKIERLGDVIAPPSGRLGLGEAQLLHGRHPHHAIRLERPMRMEGESRGERNARAAETWEAWKKAGVVVPCERAFYRYRYRSATGERALDALVGRVEVLGGSNDLVETAETWEAVVASRRGLYEATGALGAPLVFLYDDDGGQVRAILDEAKADVIRAETESFVESLSRVDGREREEDLREFFLRRPILLLEGHHRLAAIRAAAKARGLSQAFAPAVFLDRKSGGFELLARCRLAVPERSRRSIDPAQFLERLEALFEIETYPYKGAAQKGIELENLLEEIRTVGRVTPTFGLYLGDGTFRCLFLKDPEAYERENPAERSRRWKRTDVVVIETTVFQGVLEGRWKTGLAARPRDAVDMVDEGEAAAAFFLLPPLLADVVRLARAGERLPPRPFVVKPSPSTGLLIAELDAPV